MSSALSARETARFDTAENGIRALGKLLINYRGKDGIPGVGGPGIDTIKKTINRWAPAGENDTGSYIAAVGKTAGVRPDQPIDIRDRRILTVVVMGIMVHENGSMPYTQAVISEGVKMALGASY
jgi:hypothetical protein